MRTVQFYRQDFGSPTKQQARMDLAMAALSVASSEMDNQDYRKAATALRAASTLLDELSTINEKGEGD